MRKMNCANRAAVALVALLVGIGPVHADQFFQGGFFDTHGNAGEFAFFAVHDSGDQWTAKSGKLTVTSGRDTGNYDLYSIGDNPGSVGHYSPTGNFYFNNNFYYPGAALLLDTGGLLFVNNGRGASGVVEVSLWGPLSPPGDSAYSFWSSGPATAQYLTTSDTATFFIVPEPATISMWFVLFGISAMPGLLRRFAWISQAVT